MSVERLASLCGLCLMIGSNLLSSGPGADPVVRCGEAARLLQSVADPREPVPLPLGEKQIFLDSYVLSRLDGVERKLHQPTKYGPVLRPDRPWETEGVQIRTAPSWDPEKKTWVLWYRAGGNAGFAVSRDGVHWEKPALGLREYKGSTQNNLLLHRVLPETIFRDTHDPDPRRRYKGFASRGIVELHRVTRLYPAVSADGLVWQVSSSFIRKIGESHVFFDQRSKLYVVTAGHPGPWGRSVYLSVSRDFEHWTDPRDCLIFHADERDQERNREWLRTHLGTAGLLQPVVNRPEQYGADIYALPVFRYEGVYVGVPSVFHRTGGATDRAGVSAHDGFNVAELSVSRDLMHWERVAARASFIPLSPLAAESNYDTGQVLASNRPVRRDGQLWFYYTGAGHRVDSENQKARPHPEAGVICLAKLRLDGFVSLHAGERPGRVFTKPLLITGKRLHLNVDATRGAASVEVLDAVKDEVLAGSVPVTGDRLDAEVRWQSGAVSAFVGGKPVRLRFTLREADLYAFWID